MLAQSSRYIPNMVAKAVEAEVGGGDIEPRVKTQGTMNDSDQFDFTSSGSSAGTVPLRVSVSSCLSLFKMISCR